MIRHAVVVTLILGLAAAGGTMSAIATEPPIIRVGILLDQPSIRIEADGPLIAADVLGGSTSTLIGGPWVFQSTADGMAISGTAFGSTVRVTTPSGFLRANGQPYRGSIEVRRVGPGRLTAINELDLERYLYGVIKGEIDPHWPPEAVKAQAVAARTLALQNLAALRGKFASEGYTLRATTDSQIYLGAAGEDPGASAAVEATRGIVMTFRGQPIFAAYHSNSGGHTEDSENVWGTPHPYLRGVPDPYALDAPGGQWTARLSLAGIETGLRRGGVTITGIAGIELGRATPWGRAITVRLTDEAGRPHEIAANQFRLLIGPGVVRSTMFVMTRDGSEVAFSGRGSGHGVGLDQWGARALALKGYTFEQILSYYYTGIAIERRF
ncbi:MAG TPA: SpoIID/LytB domain-containing protein [bacterium]|nr:SpoIID/LytB domain-containing protein [bacterium]